MFKSFFFQIFYLFILGGLSSFSLPPFDHYIINFITFSLFFIFLFKKKKYLINKKISFFYGWSFGFGYFITNLYWISISLSFDQNFSVLIPFTIILIPAFLSIFYGFATCLFLIFKKEDLISSFFLFPLLMGMVEVLRGYLLTGFPWNLIGYSFSSSLEMIQIVSVIGTYAFNIFCITFFIIPSILILRKNKNEFIFFIIILIIPIFFFNYGYFKIKKSKTIDYEKKDFTIRIIGSNISLERFYRIGDAQSILQELIEISRPNLKKNIFFIWPEGIIPNTNQDELIKFKEIFDNNFNKNHLIGMGINSKTQDEKFYNTFSFYDSELNLINSYQKVNLVPFGEFLPFEKLFQKFGAKALTNNYQSYSSGLSRDIIKLDNDFFSIKFLPMICYEIIYSGQISKNNDFDLIINISEDGWFGKSIGPKQHFVHSIFRAIESGKYVLRSANNGIAGIIDPIGNIEKKIEFGETGFLDFEKQKKFKRTYFSKYGNMIILPVVLLYLCLFILFTRKK